MESRTLERTYHLKTGSLGLEILTRKTLLSVYQTCSSRTMALTFVMSRTHLILLSNQEKSGLELWRKVFILCDFILYFFPLLYLFHFSWRGRNHAFFSFGTYEICVLKNVGRGGGRNLSWASSDRQWDMTIFHTKVFVLDVHLISFTHIFLYYPYWL